MAIKTFPPGRIGYRVEIKTSRAGKWHCPACGGRTFLTIEEAKSAAARLDPDGYIDAACVRIIHTGTGERVPATGIAT